MLLVEQAVRGRGADDLVAEELPRGVDVVDLGVLAELVVDLTVPVLDLTAQVVDVDERCVRVLRVCEVVHPRDEGVKVIGDDPVLAVVHEVLDRDVHAGSDLAEELAELLVGEVGVLLRAGEDELLAGDGLVQHEPAVAVAGAADVGQGGEVV